MAASSARALMLFRVTDLYLPKPVLHPPRPPPPPHRSSLSGAAVISCLSGGGVSDDYFVSTRRSRLDRGFAVIANLVSRIEPLDNSVISKGVSDSAKDSMKQTISSMLGLLPSDQFSVSIAVSKQPLHRLIISSIITGYTLWNAEYRVSLTRNLDISVGAERQREEPLGEKKGFYSDERKNEDRRNGFEELEGLSPQVLGDLPTEALNYVQELQSELSSANAELEAQRTESMRIERERGYRNDLLEYLRSLDPEMVTELSQPSSSEVEEIIHQLVHNVLRRFFEEESASEFTAESPLGSTKDSQGGGDETCGTVGTSRDYLAKLLFWCMLLGHHLRGLENRLHLSCAVGLL